MSVSKTVSAVNDVTPPVRVYPGNVLIISISGSFTATVTLQRLIPSTDDMPSPSDSTWYDVADYTAAEEDKMDTGDGCWYRLKCTAFTDGTPVMLLDRI